MGLNELVAPREQVLDFLHEVTGFVFRGKDPDAYDRLADRGRIRNAAIRAAGPR